MSYDSKGDNKDAPLIIYYKGAILLNSFNKHLLSIVDTRDIVVRK